MLRPEGLFGGTDPALTPGSAQVPYATCAMLLNYPDEPFPAGARLQPEVAAAMPTVSDGGRTYTFRVRPGFRFSPPSNEPVTADAFRRAIERGLHPRTESYATVIHGRLVGARRITRGRAKRVSGVTARGDTLTIRLTAPSATLPARIASPLFCAVPPATPITAPAPSAIPMAGPYYIASYVPERHLLLRRNPNYGGQRPRGMREIDIDLDVSLHARGDARSKPAAPTTPAASRSTVSPRSNGDHGPDSAAAQAGRQRYFSGPAPVTALFVMNTRRPLFAGTRMRRAVNFALDRRALARRSSTAG